MLYKYFYDNNPWRTMQPPINGRICPLENADKVTNMSNLIQDTTYLGPVPTKDMLTPLPHPPPFFSFDPIFMDDAKCAELN